MLRIEQCSIRAKISLHEPQNLQNLFVVTREIDNMGDVGSEVRLHFYKETIHWNAGRRGTVWYNKAPAVSGAIPMTHITQYFHEHSDGESLRANVELVLANAALAAEVAVALAALGGES